MITDKNGIELQVGDEITIRFKLVQVSNGDLAIAMTEAPGIHFAAVYTAFGEKFAEAQPEEIAPDADKHAEVVAPAVDSTEAPAEMPVEEPINPVATEPPASQVAEVTTTEPITDPTPVV